MTMKEVKLGDISTELTVGHVGAMANEYLSNGIPFLRSLNIKPYRIDTHEIRYVSSEFHGRLRKSALTPGDVVIVRTGKPGTCAVIPDWLEIANCSDLVIVRCSEKIRPRYLAYWVNSIAEHHINSSLVGAVQQHFNVGAAREMPVLLPSIRDQDRTLEVLASLDDKIELNRRMNETLEEMARALFRDWFVDFGPTRRQLAGETDPTAIMGHAFPPAKAKTLAPLFPATLGEDGLPFGWVKRVLHDLSEWINGAAYKNMHFSEERDALPVVKIAELKAGVRKTTKFTNTALGEKYRIADGEVLFSWSGNPDTSIDTFIWSGGDAWLNQHIFAVRPNGSVGLPILYFLLKFLRPQFAEAARDKQTTGLGHVTKQDLRSIRVCLGTDEVLVEATRALEPMYQKIYCNQLENRTLAQIRDLLLPKLMSGEIRLGDVEQVS